ncbi:MAG: cell division protein FtsL [Gammaproteobacteria bacterium]|nr:MAG: cell division protein FtsL [Gammaproteobacteria bacterium]
MIETVRRYAPIVVLMGAVMAAAIASVYAKHESRKLFTELQSLNTERDRMEVNWGRLQIEQSTWSAYGRVEQMAREQMQMRMPAPEQVSLLGE